MDHVAISYGKFATSKSGGARESLLTLLQGITETSEIDVNVYQTPPADDPPDTDFGYRLHTKRLYRTPKLTWIDRVISRRQWGRYLRRHLNPDYDFLLTQSALAPVSVQVADELNIPSLFFVRSMALTGYEKYDPDRGHLANIVQTDIGGKVQYPFLWRNFRDYRRAVTTASYTIANSEFTAEKLRELFGVDPTVIYPPIELERYETEHDADGYITMVNPRAEYKGADIFVNIAEELSEERFLLVGPISSDAIRERSRTMSNVSHWEWCDDMREAYAESKLVVVPSRWEEPFGRVPAEAMVSGIPCVVSDRGGLPEVVGETGEVVERIDSVDEWVDAIDRALTSHDPEAQKQRVKRFSAERQVKKLCRVVDDIMGR
jgi:glycosyltransferase involved in cell wall biosynthesis